jgi:hypothetical protein
MRGHVIVGVMTIYLRNNGTGVDSSAVALRPRPLSREEIVQRQKLTAFLDSASEDKFTEWLLVPWAGF